MRWSVALVVAACSSSSTPERSVGPAPTYDPHRDSIPIVDSHVHLAYDPVANELAAHGVRAVVDLAAPESALSTKYPIQVIQAGPMLTHPGGYPLDAWGADGYGIGCDTVACVDSTIDRLDKEGARIIKVALDEDGLAPVLVGEAVKHAHARGLKVAVHALSNAGASVGGRAGADVLAHTPVEPLSDETLAAWSVPPIARTGVERDKHARAVITTLAAFGGSDSAVENLRKLRAAGLTVLYGTDLGNLRVDGPSADEMALMKKAGMTDAEIEAAMTTVPWHFWGFDAMRPVPGTPAAR